VTDTTLRHDPYLALRNPSFRRFLIGRLIAVIGGQVQSVAVGWDLYERTHSAFALGLIGLVTVIPVIALALPAGHVADRFSRKWIVATSQIAFGLTSVGLAVVSYFDGPVEWIYVLLFIGGVAQAFHNPARGALLPQIVSEEAFENAVTWNTSTFQIGSVIGPALGGWIIALNHTATGAYLFDTVATFAFATTLATMNIREAARTKERMTLQSLGAGLKFVLQTKVILAAITLDLFAVLFGGATMLLPLFAKDILHVGPTGLGWLRTAPWIGAFLMSLAIAHRGPMKRAGRTLLLVVIAFGLITIAFGFSRSFGLSMLLLLALGAVDSVSMVIRSALVQLWTPESMRGRVSAINSVFVDTSNELGGFESGAAAAAFGPVASVVGGGVATIVVVLIVMRVWPELLALRALAPASVPVPQELVGEGEEHPIVGGVP
jgi:MFS family permease